MSKDNVESSTMSMDLTNAMGPGIIQWNDENEKFGAVMP